MDSYRERAERPVFTYNEGREELAHLNLRVLEVVPEGGIYFRLSSGRHAPNSHLYISPEYENLRDIKELERMVITSEKNRTQKPSSPGRHVQTIPASFDPFDDHITKIIYADRVSIIDYESETAFTVQSERYARYEEKLFRLLSRLLAESK